MSDISQKSARQTLSREEQIAEINLNLKSELLSCGLPTPKAEEAIALLYNEISTSIQSGKYPHNFPQWNKRLKELSVVTGKEQQGEQACNILTDERLTTKLPSYLYSLTLKTENIREGEEALGQYFYKPSANFTFPLGKMRVSQGANRLEFELQCHDFAKNYAALVLESASEQKQNPVRSRKVTSRIGEVTPDISVEGLNNIGRFTTLLSLNDDNSRNVLFPRFIDGILPKDDSARRERPEQFDSFIADLKSDADISVNLCNQDFKSDYDSANVKYQDTNCLTMTFGSSARTYMVYFSYMLDFDPQMDAYFKDIPRIEFVQLLAPINID